MANSIELAKKYANMLDEVYALVSLTSDLDGDPDLVQQGANANELIIPKMDMQGLGDYDRNSGYVKGNVTMTNETVKCNFDRGRKFDVDVMDDVETAGLAFGRLAGEFERTKVTPELDAFRFATYCGASGITKKEETFTNGEQVVQALCDAQAAMDEAEVPSESRYLYITPTLLGMIKALDTTKSREVLDDFAGIKKVPQKRFYTAIKQLTGKSGEDSGGYAKAEGAADLNFMIIEKSAVIQYPKHVAPKIIAPENNADSDGYIFGYRHVGIAEVYENKVAGIHASHKPAMGG